MFRIAEGGWITLALELLNDRGLVDYGLGDDGVGQQLVGNNCFSWFTGLLVRWSEGPRGFRCSDVRRNRENARSCSLRGSPFGAAPRYQCILRLIVITVSTAS